MIPQTLSEPQYFLQTTQAAAEEDAKSLKAQLSAKEGALTELDAKLVAAQTQAKQVLTRSKTRSKTQPARDAGKTT